MTDYQMAQKHNETCGECKSGRFCSIFYAIQGPTGDARIFEAQIIDQDHKLNEEMN